MISCLKGTRWHLPFWKPLNSELDPIFDWTGDDLSIFQVALDFAAKSDESSSEVDCECRREFFLLPFPFRLRRRLGWSSLYGSACGSKSLSPYILNDNKSLFRRTFDESPPSCCLLAPARLMNINVEHNNNRIKQFEAIFDGSLEDDDEDRGGDGNNA